MLSNVSNLKVPFIIFDGHVKKLKKSSEQICILLRRILKLKSEVFLLGLTDGQILKNCNLVLKNDINRKVSLCADMEVLTNANNGRMDGEVNGDSEVTVLIKGNILSSSVCTQKFVPEIFA